TNLMLFSFPIMFLASFGCIYLHFQTISTPKSTTVVKKSRLDIFKRPLIVMNPLGIVTATEFMFSAMFVVLLGWSLGNYLYIHDANFVAGMEYTPSSILFVNVPLISKMQWHPFTVTSNANMDPDTLSIAIKCQGTWSHKLYQQLSSSPIDRLQVSVEGPYGPASPHFLSGGSGIMPFISIIREISFQRARQQQQPNKNHTIPASVLLICAFKNSTDLSMLDLLLPLTSNSIPSDLSQINLQIQANITRETEQQQPLVSTKKPLQTIWFKPNTSDSPISPPLGPNSWLWLCVIITSSFIMFLIFLGILIRYHIYPVELAKGRSAYNYTFQTLWDMFFVCACWIVNLDSAKSDIPKIVSISY
nr:ferric reduction oxidase 4-like [Tanacetum cinerariifolium]